VIQRTKQTDMNLTDSDWLHHIPPRGGGRKPAPEATRNRAKGLRSRGLSIRRISAVLAEEGHLGASEKPYAIRSIELVLQSSNPSKKGV
jgi:hypothetical protein